MLKLTAILTIALGIELAIPSQVARGDARYGESSDVGSPSGALPIMVLIDVHADPMVGPPLIQQQTYHDWRDATNRALDEAEPRGAKISFLSTGQFMEWVLEDPDQGNPLMQRLYASGGQIGTHSHNKIRYGAHDWRELPFDVGLVELRQMWLDHVGAVNAVITAALGISDAAGLQAVNSNRGSHIPGDAAVRIPMMEELGFTIHEQGPEQVFYEYFNHYVMNPYRPSKDGILIHDPAGPVVLSPAGWTPGLNGLHLNIRQDSRVQAKQARFLLELLNWLNDAQAGGTERLWTYGWGSHCEDYMPDTITSDAFIDIMDWLSEHFIGKPVGGQVAATFASVPEARDAYYAWETAHPGETSFSYSASKTVWDLYPYLRPAAAYLAHARYVQPMPPRATVRWHELEALPDICGPFEIFVAYTTDGVPVVVDLSLQLGVGNISVVDPASGDATVVSTTAVPVASTGAILVSNENVIKLPTGSEEEVRITNPASGIDLFAHIHRPTTFDRAATYPAVLLVPGGNDPGTWFDRDDVAQSYADLGCIVMHFDPDGRGRSTVCGTFTEENYNGFVQQEGLRAALKALIDLPETDDCNIGVMSRSYGITMAAGVLGRFPSLNVKYLIDWEGPATRADTEQPNGHVPSGDEAWWFQREPVNFIDDYRGYYLRVQSEVDHVQPDNNHAIILNNRATNTAFGGDGSCGWTRVNGESVWTTNTSNTVWSPADPPEWLAEELSTEMVLREFMLEMAAMPAQILAGDANGDCQLRLDDLAFFPGCMSGPSLDADITNPACDVFDVEPDDDVDIADLAELVLLFSGK